MGRPAGIAALVLVAAAATILGYFMGRDRQEAEPGQPPAAEARVPETRPLFSLQDTQGEPRSIAEWDGRALLINFYLLPPAPGLEWFLPVFFLKLLVSHLPKEAPFPAG